MTGRSFPCQPVAARAGEGHVPVVADKDRERQEKLAAALRENLRKRKAQARHLTEKPEGSEPG